MKTGYRFAAALLAGIVLAQSALAAEVVYIRKAVKDWSAPPSGETPPPPPPVYTYAWQYGEWVDPGPTCGTETHTRSASCVRNDGQGVSETFCNAAAREDLSREMLDESACSFEWKLTSTGPWSSTCSNSATRELVYGCYRNTIYPVADEKCREPKPSGTETGSNYSQCGGLVVNGSFELDKTGWTFEPSTGISTQSANTGSKSASTGVNYVSQIIAVTKGKPYRFSYAISRRLTGCNTPQANTVRLWDRTSGADHYTSTNVTACYGTWVTKSVNFVPSGNSVEVKLLYDGWLVDDVDITAL